jgi:hypothetical protein
MSQSAIIEGEFPAGPELMLWRPDVNHRWLRWRAILWPVLRTLLAAALGVAAFAVLLTGAAPGSFWPMVPVAGLLTGLSAVCVVVEFRCAEYDHRHRRGKPCRLETEPGAFFYRAGDFCDLPTSTTGSVHRIIAAVAKVHSSPAAAWLAPQQLRDVHRVAWDVLCLVDRTRTLRDVLTNKQCTAFDEIALVRSFVTDVDVAVDRVLTCLLQAELLVTAWEQKLVEIDQRAQLRAELNAIRLATPLAAIGATVQKAEVIPESMFAYITAARDLTNSGPFDWERLSHRIQPA